MSNAFSNALALESVGELGIFNAATGTYSGVTHDDLVRYARTVAYKVFHNLKLGHTMSKEDDPLTVDGVSAANVWADHYEFVSENPLCGEWYRVPYPPTDAMKDAWNNDDSNDFNTAYLAMVHASPAADQCCGKCEKPDGRATVTDNASVDQETLEFAQPSAEQYQAEISNLVQRLQTADAVITTLVVKSGGEVVLTPEDAAAAAGTCVVADVSEDRTTFTIRAVPVQQAAEMVQ